MRPYSRRSNVIFVGNGENPTNIYALKWYVALVAPELDKGIPGMFAVDILANFIVTEFDFRATSL